MRLRTFRLAALALLAPAAAAQPVVFDEADGAAGYYLASDGEAAGGDVLERLGPDGRRMPLVGQSVSGVVGGRLTARHQEGGAWRMDVGAPGFAAFDLSQADSLVLWLNGPAGVAGVRLPRLSLVDAAGRETARLPLAFATAVGLDLARSGFLPGSPTTAVLRPRYVSTLPAAQPRPGYPETLRVTFADTVVAQSTPAIGVPSVPARFAVTTASGQPLAFRFLDANGDGTLSGPTEYVDVLIPEAEGGPLRPTWRLDTNGGTPAVSPGAGSVYRLAVQNAGVDGDPATWQRRAVALSDFGPLGGLDRAAVRAVRLSNPDGPFAATAAPVTLWIDAVRGVPGTGTPTGPAPPTGIAADTGDRTVLLRWTPTPGASGVFVYRRTAGAFELLTPNRVTQAHYADMTAPNGVAATYVLRSVGAAGVGTPGASGPDSPPVEAAAVAGAADPYLDLTQRLAFDYFWLEANPANGLVRDRSTETSASSIAAVGFGLSALTVGVDRGYVTRAQAAERTLATLRFFATCPQSDAPTGTCGTRGFFYHFLSMQTGERAGTNELSTIDTALLLGGVLHAATYFDGADAAEAEIRERAEFIARRVEWSWATPRPPRVALGWLPESGFLPFDWRGYNEAMLLYVLGLGSPTFPLRADAWDAWTADYAGQWQTHYGLTFLTFPPLFGHQYSHVWIDFRGIQDDYMRGRGIDYFENSRRATLANRAYAIDNPLGHPGYGPNEWGLTASDYPGGYRARGAPPAENDDGTIAPTAAGGSFAFTPVESREALRHFYQAYRPRLWGPYGLRDAFNVRQNWVATDYLGIDQGPILLMIENERTGAVWSRFMTHPHVQAGLARAGFAPTTVDGEADAPAPALALGLPAPNPARGAVAVGYTLAAPGAVRLDVFDALGRRVATLADGERAAGSHALSWDARGVAPGVYTLRLDAGAETRARRVVVAR